ncbi:transaldolase B [Halomonas cupida]|uniref:Transaldolase n=1 Tax=Halomonas cupida TaxID=44933 RepID=A0A1M7FE35_9GAMM|nr:transaldolase [Halomonas cupida]GEN23518.1 transaldolase B [Halomonas cupida]SHM02344.1 transaldolase [Halomonas cupida]
MSQLDALRRHSLVVADTGDLDAIKRYQPQDATTNPSLILKAFELPGYHRLIDDVLARTADAGADLECAVSEAVDALSVSMGAQISAHIPGRISTEVAARLSFDTEASIRKAHELIERYERLGVDRDRVLIKLASTWEGIRAAEVLEKEGIQCNLTLLFSEAQARACFDAGVYLISPFVGRVSDYYRQRDGRDFAPDEDPGVTFVRGVCELAHQGGYDTVVMGASFRSTGQVLALAGCPRLTISPDLLEQLAASEGEVDAAISTTPGNGQATPRLDEASYRWRHNLDAMAVDKLADGIRRFADDQSKLETLIAERLK